MVDKSSIETQITAKRFTTPKLLETFVKDRK